MDQEQFNELQAHNPSPEAEIQSRGRGFVNLGYVLKIEASLKAKDKLLRELLAYAEEGLLIDEHLAAHIEQVLEGQTDDGCPRPLNFS